jgi:hypothetical protein
MHIEKLTVAQVKKGSALTEVKDLLSCSQGAAVEIYSEPVQSSPQHHALFLF